MAREPTGERTAMDSWHAFAAHACLGWLSLLAPWFLCLFLMMLVIKPRILGMLGRCSTVELHPQSLFSVFLFFIYLFFLRKTFTMYLRLALSCSVPQVVLELTTCPR